MIKDFTGLLLLFIGLIIGLFTGYGLIVALIGLFMLAGDNSNFRRARNFFIASVIVTIGGSLLVGAAAGTFAIAVRNGLIGPILMGFFAFVIAFIAFVIALFFIDYNAYGSILGGCRDVAESRADFALEEKCTTTYYGYRNSLIAVTVLTCACLFFCWVPVLNIVLFVITACVAAWYFVEKILVIIRVWQTYSLKNNI